MSIHLTKEELQEIWSYSLSGEERTVKAGEYYVWADIDDRGYLILYYAGDEIPYLQGKGDWTKGEHKPMEGWSYTFNEGIDFEPYDWPHGITLSESEL
ncbi:MAG: hypothetical protein HRT73_16730, partial [Flavobacteriales bacterium]|nr:hypothetical protein [Flavobacteriales bacterium]